MRKLAGEINFAQTSFKGGVGRVAPRPLYDILMKGGRRIGERSRRLELLPLAATRIIRPIGRAVDVRTYSDACTTGGGLPAVALLPRTVARVCSFAEWRGGAVAARKYQGYTRDFWARDVRNGCRSGRPRPAVAR